MARPEQGAQGTPKFQQCASGRRGGAPHCLDGVRGAPRLQQCASERQGPPHSLNRLERNLGEDSEGFAGTRAGERPTPSRGGWSPPLRAGQLQAGPALATFLQQSLQGREKGPSQDS